MNLVKKLIGFLLFTMFFIGGCFALRDNYAFLRSHEKFSISIDSAKNTENIMPVVIIGSGPAALSAGLYSSRSDLETLIVRGNKPGGALTETSYIENWPGRTKVLGSRLMEELSKQVEDFGAKFLNDVVIEIDASHWPYKIKTEGGKIMYAMAIIVATGSTPKTLGIDGEKKYWGKGVTTCAVCDAPFFKNKDVVVIGGGDTAAEEAMQLAPYAKSIFILVRNNKMRASAVMQKRLEEYGNITIMYNKELKKIEGENDHVIRIELLDKKNNEIQKMLIDGVFLAIGHTPNTALVKNIVQIDEQGYIVLNDRSQKTSQPFLYAAGDVADKDYKQAGVAAGDGIKAALDAVGALQEIGYSTKFAGSIKKNFFVHVIEEKSKPIKKISAQAELQKILEEAQGPVILDFFAEYCSSCMRMLPALESVAYQFDKKIEFYKVDMETENDLAETYKITSIPTLLVFKDGKEIERHTKAMNKKELKEYGLRFIRP